MLATLDANNLLCIEDPAIDTGKIYQQCFQGYLISEHNKLLFIIHKKEIKLIELKNIGDTMGVFYLARRAALSSFPMKIESLAVASQLFKGRDEQQGNHYYFLPYFSPKTTIATNKLLETLHLPFQLTVNEKGVMVSTSLKGKFSSLADLPQSKEDYLSFLF
jgi:hypothetical protein